MRPAILCLLWACAAAPTPAGPKPLHDDAIVIDTHNDVTSAILDKGFDLGDDGARGPIRTQTDLARMKKGGLDAEFFAIYVGAAFMKKTAAEGGGAARRALDMIDGVYRQIARHPDTLELAVTADDIVRIARKGKIAALMGIEGGHAIEDSLGALRMFYKLGVRYLTLTHTNTNDWADSSGDAENENVHHHHGLSPFGEKVVLEMNRVGMMVDISHVSDETFWAVMRVSQAPVIASHSSARALSPHPRNLSDEMLAALGKNGGVAQVNFFDVFLDPEKAQAFISAGAFAKLVDLVDPFDTAKLNEAIESWTSRTISSHRIPLAVLVDHIDHMVKVAGVDHVGLGSDFDGLPTVLSTPEGVDDVSQLPNLRQALLARGYSEENVRKILGGNFLRVMREVEATARRLDTTSK